jgi:ACS family pantothenate transporter-like MFS transporter
MKEDLSLYGNELNYLETYYRIGYALFTIPSQIIMLRVRPSIWLPLLEARQMPLFSSTLSHLLTPRELTVVQLLASYNSQLVWGVLTACMAACTSVRPMYAIRFFIGVAEASYVLFPRLYPGYFSKRLR